MRATGLLVVAARSLDPPEIGQNQPDDLRDALEWPSALQILQ